MQNAKIKLQDAFNKGFVPKDIQESMAANGHEGQVYIVETDDIHENKDETRLGIGYKVLNEAGEPGNAHIVWYDPKEVQALLKEI